MAWRSSIAMLLGVAAAVVLAHGPSLGFGYTWLDDDRLVLSAQPSLVRPGAALRAFGEEVMHKPRGGGGFYRPMLTLSLIPAARLAGRAPFGHHLTNLLLHLAASALVLAVLMRMTRRRGWPLAFACLYAVHPALAQAVAWVPGRNDTLLAVFALSSFLFFLRYREGGRARDLAAHVALWGCALLTKESAVVLPLLCLLEVALVERDSLATARGPLAAWIPAGAAWFAARSAVIGLTGLGPGRMALDAARNAPALLLAAGHAVLPFGLTVYPVIAGVPWTGIAAVALAAVLVGAARGDDRRRAAFGAAWFALFLLPTLAEPSLSGDRVVFDHRIATGLLGLGLLVPVAWIDAWARRSPWSARAAGAAAVVLLALATRRYEPRFFDAPRFWRSAVAGAPRSAFARNGLGATLYRQGDAAGAEAEWRVAADLDPSQRFVHENLGLACLRDGRTAEAAREFETEMAVNPAAYRARLSLGELRERAGDGEAAVRLWAEAVDLRPGDAAAYVLLLRHFLATGDTAALATCAREADRRGVALPPDLAADVRARLGGAP